MGRLSYQGFGAMHSLSTHFNETPTQGSRPFDRIRSGFVMGEGAVVMVLESLDRARARNAPILISFHFSAGILTKLRSDWREQQLRRVSHHFAPSGRVGSEDLHGAAASQDGNLRGSNWVHQCARHRDANRRPRGNAGDSKRFWRGGEETGGVVDEGSDGTFAGSGGRVGGGDLRVRDKESGRKGGFEGKEVLPPTLNLEESEIAFGFDLLAKQAKRERVNFCLSNSFGFGGVNVSLLFGRVNESNVCEEKQNTSHKLHVRGVKATCIDF